MENRQLTFVATLLEGGQITIPEPVRRALLLRKDALVEVTVRVVETTKRSKIVEGP